ncbi:hypothetical protein POTOM_059557 [Populus tomentosa]|uniref:Uncharacterized protein n=1 Tax=Populus tomentosa TaxID=118781 RepID=A0A8X8BWM4_POPTO|nr:hypothetical protein POTOM_059557 [Populus tomentosa]
MSVPDDVKKRLADEIAKDYCFRPEILALVYVSELQQQILILLERNIENISNLHRMCMLAYPMHNRAEKEYNFSSLNSQSKYEVVALGTEERPVASSYDTTAPEHKGERKMAAPSSESRRQFPEEMIIYLDYVEEVQSITKQGSCQDKRIFKFKSSPALPRKEKVEEGSCDVKRMDQYETESEKSSSSNSRTRADETVRRSRRSLSREHSSVKDIEYVIYYYKPCK